MVDFQTGVTTKDCFATKQDLTDDQSNSERLLNWKIVSEHLYSQRSNYIHVIHHIQRLKLVWKWKDQDFRFQYYLNTNIM